LKGEKMVRRIKKKKLVLAKFDEQRRSEAHKSHRLNKYLRKPKSKYNDGLTSQQRKQKRIKDAANGCWWIEQYIMGTLSYSPNSMNGVDDE
tara:strand:+ start:430 stop:702 length:273 start_codon:yes stop_codon:yes gene_type:complete